MTADWSDLLNDYLDEREADAVLTSNDPGLVRAILWFNEVGAQPLPDPTFRDRLEQEVLLGSAGARSTLASSKRSGGTNRTVRSQFKPLPARGWVSMSLAVAVLMLTVGLSIFTLGQFRTTPNNTQSIPGAIAPDTNGQQDSTTLFETLVPAAHFPGNSPADSGMVQFTIPSGSATSWKVPALRFEYVLSGEYSVRSDGEVQILRSGSAAPESVSSGEGVDMHSGDALIAPVGTTSEYSTDATTEADILVWFLVEERYSSFSYPETWANNARSWKPGIALTPGSGRLSFRRLELEAGETALAPFGALRLGLSLPDPESSSPSTAKLVDSVDGIQNTGESSATVYVVTLEFLPATEPTATPEPNALADETVLLPSEETLYDVTLGIELLQNHETRDSALAGVVIPPNVLATWSVPALRVEYVIEGSYEVTSDAPASVVRSAGDGEIDAAPAGTSVSLGPGDVLILPKGGSLKYASGPDGASLMVWVFGDHRLSSLGPAGWFDHEYVYIPFTAARVEPQRVVLRRYNLEGRGVIDTRTASVFYYLETKENAAGTPRAFALGETSKGIRNLGDAVVTVYVVTLEPIASPIAGSPEP